MQRLDGYIVGHVELFFHVTFEKSDRFHDASILPLALVLAMYPQLLLQMRFFHWVDGHAEGSLTVFYFSRNAGAGELFALQESHQDPGVFAQASMLAAVHQVYALLKLLGPSQHLLPDAGGSRSAR